MPLLSIVSIMLKLGKERFNSFSLYLGWDWDWGWDWEWGWKWRWEWECEWEWKGYPSKVSSGCIFSQKQVLHTYPSFLI